MTPCLPSIPFAPTYIFQSELAAYDLPNPSDLPAIMTLVQLASVLIDEECGRYDGDGSGSLVYSTYIQRVLLQTRNRNLIQLAMKPLAAVPSGTIAALQASGTAATGSTQPYYTGAQPYLYTAANGFPSGIIGASGRYGYTRQDMSVAYPDLFALINPLNLVTLFGGPAPWVAIDITNTDYDPKTGEVWIPAGLQLQRYAEVLMIYTSGYDPRNMPPIIKLICASIVKNAMAKGNATTAMTALSMGRSGTNFQFYNDLIDPVLSRMLTPFRTVRGY